MILRNKTDEIVEEISKDHKSTVVLVLVTSVVGLIYLLNMKNIPFQEECPRYVKLLYCMSICIFFLLIIYMSFILLFKNY